MHVSLDHKNKRARCDILWKSSRFFVTKKIRKAFSNPKMSRAAAGQSASTCVSSKIFYFQFFKRPPKSTGENAKEAGVKKGFDAQLICKVNQLWLTISGD